MALALFGISTALLVSSLMTYRLSTTKNESLLSAASSFGTRGPGTSSPLSSFNPQKNLFAAALEPQVEPVGESLAARAPVAPPARLLVVGVMMGDRSRSSAIIRFLDADSTVVIPQGGWVFGRTEYLSRVEPNGVVLAGGYGRRRLRVGVMPNDQPAIIEAVRPPVSVTAEAPGMNVSRAEINASIKSPEQIIGESKLTPEIRNGAIVGVRVTVVADSSIIKKMGMEANDIIRSVNGQNLDSLERSTQIWEQAKKASEIHMLVERNGVERSMSYYMRP